MSIPALWSRVASVALCASALALGCLPPASALNTASIEPKESTLAFRLRPIFDLEEVDVPIPGRLELRTNHRISAYDELLVRQGRLRYRHGSLELSRDAEEVFLELLDSSLVSAIEDSGVPMADRPGRCAMEVEMGVANMDLETADHSPELVKMVVVMAFRDSVSGDPLLRYSRSVKIDQPGAGDSDDSQLRRGLAKIVEDMDVSGVLRPAGLVTDETIEGCEGFLGQRGQEMNAPEG